MRKCAIISISVLLFTAGLCRAGEKVTLEQKFVPGTYVTTMTTDMRNATQMPNARGEIKQGIKMLMVMETTVEKPSDKGQTIRITYKRFRQSVTSGSMSISYDSAKATESQNPQMAKIYGAMLDHEIRFTMDSEGKIVDSKGLDEMWDKMGAGNPAMALVVKNMKKQFGNTMLKQMISSSSRYMPDKPVAVGDTWETNTKQNVPVLGEIDFVQQCKLTDLPDTPAGKVAVIVFTGKMKSDKPTTTDMGQGKMTFTSVDMTMTGKMNVNIANTTLTTTVMDMSSRIKMSVGGPEGRTMDMAVDTKGTVKTTVRPGRYEPPATQPAAESSAAQ